MNLMATVRTMRKTTMPPVLMIINGRRGNLCVKYIDEQHMKKLTNPEPRRVNSACSLFRPADSKIPVE